MGRRKVMVKFKVGRRTPTIRRPPKRPLPRPAAGSPAATPGAAGK
jgi:hypothetical protein